MYAYMHICVCEYSIHIYIVHTPRPDVGLVRVRRARLAEPNITNSSLVPWSILQSQVYCAVAHKT